MPLPKNGKSILMTPDPYHTPGYVNHLFYFFLSVFKFDKHFCIINGIDIKLLCIDIQKKRLENCCMKGYLTNALIYHSLSRY